MCQCPYWQPVSQCQVPILIVQPLIMLVQPPLWLLLYPCNPHIVIIVPLHYQCQVGQDYIVAHGLLYIERRFYHLYHLRIIHSCNVLQVAPLKWLISKVLISLFFYFWSWFHNIWYQSFGFQGFTAPNRSSWNFRYKFFSKKVQKLKSLQSEAEILGNVV